MPKQSKQIRVREESNINITVYKKKEKVIKPQGRSKFSSGAGKPDSYT